MNSREKTTRTRKKGATAPFLLRRWRTIVGSVFAVAGVIGLVLPFVSFSVARPDDVLIAGQPVGASQGGTAGDDDSFFDVSQSHVKDRLLIPEYGIDMPVFTGELWSALDRGAWLMGGTRPGEQGNSVIFGHRFRYLPPLSNSMFRLGSVDYGDTFTVRWQGEEREYVVREIRIIDPEEVSVIRDQGDERVTLVTCHPVWSTKERLVVVGFPVETPDVVPVEQ